MIAALIAAGAHIAVVRGPDGVRFSASAPSDREVAERLVAYIAERCDDVLWPEDARSVRQLIDAHRADDAIAAYFATVGRRWDEEWLERRTVLPADRWSGQTSGGRSLNRPVTPV